VRGGELKEKIDETFFAFDAAYQREKIQKGGYGVKIRVPVGGG